ncbi:HNH endonuclease [Halochromatium roseum]|uniref:HNH endonuclease n=1 Tax=Halochromatium roseum TaxID=391920 RepID=UPI0019148926|nr:HNH endonuclease [Halochromatium roseum]MBK5941611.1 restriction endonuclease [Halochromatium roseum]
MRPIQDPQSFVVREECEKAAWQHGFRRQLGHREGWAGFASTTVPGTIHLAATDARGPWFLALDHAGVIEELGLPEAAMPGPGLTRYAFPTLGELYRALPHVYRLSASLPEAPLMAFQTKVKGLPKTTEAERLVIQRIGQDLFRARLLDYWQSRCPLTGITDTELLRASHIIPWSDCSSDAERLDVHNGLLLSALWDAAFDRRLVSFEDSGEPRFSPLLSEPARAALRWQCPLPLTDKHRARLAIHRSGLLPADA